MAVDGGGAIDVAGGFGAERTLTLAVNGGGRIDTRAVNASDVTSRQRRGRIVRSGALRPDRRCPRRRGHPLLGRPCGTSVVDGGGSIKPGQ